MIEFEWDPAKASENLRKHRVAFREAVTVLADGLSITVYDPDRSQGEDRCLTVGVSANSGLLMIAHTDCGGRIRIVRARDLTRTERDASVASIGAGLPRDPRLLVYLQDPTDGTEGGGQEVQGRPRNRERRLSPRSAFFVLSGQAG